MSEPVFPDDPAFLCLRVGDVAGFHRAIADRDVVDFSGVNLRGTDFRSADLTKVVLKDAYLRDSDLRGCDLRHLDLEGASIHCAKVGGAYFPRNVDPEEIQLSVEQGTRLRTNKP